MANPRNIRKKTSAKSKSTGKRIGKSKQSKSNNQRNRVVSKMKNPQVIITPDGHCIRKE